MTFTDAERDRSMAGRERLYRAKIRAGLEAERKLTELRAQLDKTKRGTPERRAVETQIITWDIARLNNMPRYWMGQLAILEMDYRCMEW